jgi:hypothetical protein
MSRAIATALGIALLAAAGPAPAELSYLGSWKIEAAAVAPWADPGRPHDRAESTRLIGKSIGLRPQEITGPEPFACKDAQYNLTESIPETLFEGAFEEMRSRDKTVDPAKIAASLGFHGDHIKMLETGCEIDFHFVDDTSAEIGLNDYVYTLKKQ